MLAPRYFVYVCVPCTASAPPLLSLSLSLPTPRGHLPICRQQAVRINSRRFQVLFQQHFNTECSFAQSPDLVRVRFWKRPGVCAPANMGRNAARSLLWALMCIAALPELETRSRSVPDLALEPKFSSRVSDLAPVPFHAFCSSF